MFNVLQYLDWNLTFESCACVWCFIQRVEDGWLVGLKSLPLNFDSNSPLFVSQALIFDWSNALFTSFLCLPKLSRSHGTVVNSYDLTTCSSYGFKPQIDCAALRRTNYPAMVINRSLKVMPTSGTGRPWPTTVVEQKERKKSSKTVEIKLSSL